MWKQVIKMIPNDDISLDELSDSEAERLWLDEAERRLDEYRAGKIKGIPGNEVFKKIIECSTTTASGVQIAVDPQ